MESLQSILPLIGIGTAGAGVVGNILSSIQQGNVASQAEKNAKLTPAQLGGMVSSATQPLDRSLIETVQNAVQGDVASRGLAESPGIFAATESQALAPFEQANQNTALQLILQKLGLPANTLMALRSGGGGMANLSPLLQMIMKMYPQATNQVPPTNAAGTDAVTQLLQQINAPADTSTPSFPGLTIPNNYTGPTDTGDFGPVSTGVSV
jgi:hypothetical protein